MDFIKLIFINIMTSTLFVGGLIWFLKYYIGKRIDNLFSEKEKILEARIRIAEKYEEKQVHDVIMVFPKIQETVYRCRLNIREIVKSGNNESLEKLREQWDRLTEQLVVYQLRLPEDVFEILHKYKSLVQNMLFAFQSSYDLGGTINEKGRTAAKEHFDEIETLYDTILDCFRNIMAERSEVLK